MLSTAQPVYDPGHGPLKPSVAVLQGTDSPMWWAITFAQTDPTTQMHSIYYKVSAPRIPASCLVPMPRHLAVCRNGVMNRRDAGKRVSCRA